MSDNDFVLPHRLECMECHRTGFDDGDWQFMGYDDDARLYICPECVEVRNYSKEALPEPPARTSDDAEKGQKSPECYPTHHSWKDSYYGYECERCGMFIPYGCEPWLPIDE